jgi:RNA polymerase sigma-70 factor (family 1)
MNLDTALTETFNKDHPAAFTALFTAYHAPLCRFAGRFVQNEEEGKDIVSEVFTNLWHKQIDDQKELYIKNYLYRAVHNKCIDALRRKKVHNEKIKILGSQPQADNSFYRQVLRIEVIQEIYEEAKLLPEQCRIIFFKLYFDGYSVDEVAKEMGLAKTTVYTQNSRAVKELRRKLFPDSLFTTTAIAVATAALVTMLVLMFLYVGGYLGL